MEKVVVVVEPFNKTCSNQFFVGDVVKIKEWKEHILEEGEDYYLKFMPENNERGALIVHDWENGLTWTDVYAVRRLSSNPIQVWLAFFNFENEEELKKAIKYAYQMGLNPLPKLREALRKAGLNYKVSWVPEDVCNYPEKSEIWIYSDGTIEIG